MSTNKIEQIQEDRWKKVLLRQEMNELQREREHLHSKSIERQLTHWELERMDSLLQEIMQLLDKFSEVTTKKAPLKDVA